METRAAAIYTELEQFISQGMSKFQMRAFVVNSFQTPYRQIKQALIEIRTRQENRVMQSFDLEDLEIKLKFVASGTTGKDQALADLERRKLAYLIDRKKALIAQIDYEISVFGSALADAVEALGGLGRATALLSDPAEMEAAETEYWMAHLSQSVFTDLVQCGTVTKGVLESVLCCTEAQQRQVMETALKKQLAFSGNQDRALALVDR